MDTYTVIMLLPDYLAENYGEDLYTTSVSARDADHAIGLAEVLASVASEHQAPPEDFKAIAVMLGEPTFVIFNVDCARLVPAPYKSTAKPGESEKPEAEDTDEDKKINEKYRKLAFDQHHRDGECEIDDNAIVSVSDDGGAYVASWVWVYDPPEEEPEEEEPEEQGHG